MKNRTSAALYPPAARKLAIMAVTAAALSLFSLAAEAGKPAPGCDATDPGRSMWGAMERASQSRRVRDRAYARTIAQTDSVLGNTCFDRALALSSRLGAIFSDVLPTNIMPSNLEIFGKGSGLSCEKGAKNCSVYSLNGGIGFGADGLSNTLGSAYNKVMGDTLTSYMRDNFTGSITNRISGYSTTVQNVLQRYSVDMIDNATGKVESRLNDLTGIGGKFTSELQGKLNGVVSFGNNNQALDIASNAKEIFSNIMPQMNKLAGDVGGTFNAGQMGNVIGSLTSALGAAGGLLSKVMDAKNAISEGLNGVGGGFGLVDGYKTDLMGNVTGVLGGAMGSPTASLSGLPWSEIAAAGGFMANPLGTAAAASACGTMGLLWGGKKADGAMEAIIGIEGGGASKSADVPLLNFDDIMTGTAAMSSGGNFADAVSSAASSKGMQNLLGLNSKSGFFAEITSTANREHLTKSQQDSENLFRMPSTDDGAGLVTWKAPKNTGVVFSPDTTTDQLIAEMPD
jgi:hypothetical protein